MRDADLLVEQVQLTPVNTPRHNGLVCGHLLVGIHTKGGLTGFGEMSDLQHLPRFHFDVNDLAYSLTHLLRGEVATDINRIMALMDVNFPEAMYVRDKSRVIRCGIDLALWDILGKVAGLPVYDLIGGKMRPSVPIAYPIFRPRSEADVTDQLEKLSGIIEQGFRLIRVYAGARPELDLQMAERLAADFGDSIQVKSIDLSNLLSWKDALKLTESLRQHIDVEMIESPAPHGDIEGLAEASRRLDIPVSEHVYSRRWCLQLIERRAVDVLNISVIASGGITNARRYLAAADLANLPTLIGTTQELAIGTAAAAHVACASPGVVYPSDPVGPWVYTADVADGRSLYRDGCLRPPDGPGLGITPDPDRVDALRGDLTWKTSEMERTESRSGR